MLIPQVKAHQIELVHQLDGSSCGLNEIDPQFSDNTDTIAYKVYHATLNPYTL